jgi:hypothetical protein
MMDFDDRIVAELNRLRQGVTPGAEPRDLLVSYNVRCMVDSLVVVSKAKEVMTAVDEHSLGDTWPSRDEWASILPTWFVAVCKPELTPEQSRQHLEWWDSLNEAQKVTYAEQPRPWSLANWVFWFTPAHRSWFWWDVRVKNCDVFDLLIEVEGHPFASGALGWLLRASGAQLVEEQ